MYILSLQFDTIMTGLKSQLAFVFYKEKINFVRIKELEKMLAIRKKKRISPLEGDLSITHNDLDIMRCAQIQTKKLSNTRKLHIEFNFA